MSHLLTSVNLVTAILYSERQMFQRMSHLHKQIMIRNIINSSWSTFTTVITTVSHKCELTFRDVSLRLLHQLSNKQNCGCCTIPTDIILSNCCSCYHNGCWVLNLLQKSTPHTTVRHKLKAVLFQSLQVVRGHKFQNLKTRTSPLRNPIQLLATIRHIPFL